MISEHAEVVKALAEMMQIALKHNDGASILRYVEQIGYRINEIASEVLNTNFVQEDK